MLMENKKQRIIIFFTVCFLILILGVGLIFVLRKPSKIKSSTAGEYRDEVCRIAFKYPQNWLKAERVVSLPQKPLAVAVFDEPSQGKKAAKNSLFSYFCFDARKYSFEQFIGQTFLKPETFSTAQANWQRIGNFIFTTKNDKLIIFQMFFTRYDLKPEVGYEDAFLNLVESTNFF